MNKTNQNNRVKQQNFLIVLNGLEKWLDLHLLGNVYYLLEDLPRIMADRDGWQESIKGICAISTTWWWLVFIVFLLII